MLRQGLNCEKVRQTEKSEPFSRRFLASSKLSQMEMGRDKIIKNMIMALPPWLSLAPYSTVGNFHSKLWK